VATVAFSRVFLLIALVTSLQAAEGAFMKCSREETPELKNYGEELLCYYTEAFLFTFPAMATAVLTVLLGRDFLQKRMYYSLLKNGGVIIFKENKSYKDPLVLTLLVDFCHCVVYTMFHVLILYRQGVAMEDLQAHGFIPEDGHLDGSNSFLALSGGGPKFGAVRSAGARSQRTSNHGDTDQAANDAMHTLMLLVTTFMETTLLIIFIWYAYDITSSLVPMSEYLDSYRDPKRSQQMSAVPHLHSFKDSVAKSILEESHDIISTVDGDLDRIYESAVSSYIRHSQEIRGMKRASQTQGSVCATTSELPFGSRRSMAIMWTKMQELSSIGLVRSMWPANLLLRRDVHGEEAKRYRSAWVIYTILSLIALVTVVLVLFVKMKHDITLLVRDHAYEQLLPLTVILVHALIVKVAAWSFAETLVPFCKNHAP